MAKCGDFFSGARGNAKLMINFFCLTEVNMINCYIYFSSISSLKSGDDFQSLDQRIQRMTDFNRIQFVTTLYLRFLLLATFALRVLITNSVSRLAPSYGVKTRGLKDPCCISITR